MIKRVPLIAIKDKKGVKKNHAFLGEPKKRDKHTRKWIDTLEGDEEGFLITNSLNRKEIVLKKYFIKYKRSIL